MHGFSKMTIFISILMLGTFVQESFGGEAEKRLLSFLFDPKRPDAHNPRERPVDDHRKNLTIRTNFSIFQITEVNERSQYISAIMWVSMFWYDTHFRWEPAMYNNLARINLPYDKIWTPTLLLYTSANQNFDQKYPSHVIIRSTTEVQWMPPGLMYSTCQMNVAWFPFDDQECIYKFGTWSYSASEIDLKPECPGSVGVCQADMSEFSKHSEWALINVTHYREEEEENGEKFALIVVSFKLQRKALYYLFNLIAPCMVISIVALLVFALPPDANEKISLGVTILLSLTLFLQMVANKLPQTSESIPVLSIYFCVTMCISSASLVCTVFLLNCRYHPSDVTSVPWWIDVLVNDYIARFLMMPVHRWKPEDEKRPKRYKRVDSWKNISNENIEFRPLSIKNPKDYNVEYDDLSLMSNDSKNDSLMQDCDNLEEKFKSEYNKLERELREKGVKSETHFKCSMSGGIKDLELILDEVRFITDKLKELNYESEVSACWKYANKVLDRFCLIIFSVVLSLTFIILPIAPKFIESFTIVGYESSV